MDRFLLPHCTTAERLVVYGSLAPGERHADVLASLNGTWMPCRIRGVLREHAGYRIYEWQKEGPAISALLFISKELPHHWQRLDEFEGDDYARIIVPVETDAGPTDAYVYADRKRLTGSEMRS